MYIERLKESVDVEGTYNSMTQQEKAELYKEVSNKKAELEREKLVQETNLQMLLKQKQEMESKLFELCGVSTIEEVVSTSVQMEQELVEQLKQFIEATKEV